MTNNTKTPYTTLFNSFKRRIKILTASLEEKDFNSFNSLFKSLDAFKSHQAENRKLNQILFHQVQAYINYVNDINTWFCNDDALSTLIAQRNGGNGNTGSSGSNGSISNTGYTYVFSEAYEIFKLVGVTPLYSKPLISEYLYHVSINSGLPFADETILNSSEQISEQIRKDVNDEVDKFIECEFSVLTANLVLFLDFAARYTEKKAAGSQVAGSKVAVNKGNNKSNKSASAGKSAGNNTEINEGGTEVAEVTEATDAKNNALDELDAEVAGYQDAINWLNSFIETKAGLAKLRAKVWETLTSGRTVDFLDYSHRATEPPSRRAAVNKVYTSIKLC